MKFTASLLALGSLITMSFAQPVAESSADPVELDSRETASGCNYYSAPRCCVPNVCQCRDGRIYQVNQDAVRGGGHGCDPPWGVIADHPGSFPGYCC